MQKIPPKVCSMSLFYEETLIHDIRFSKITNKVLQVTVFIIFSISEQATVIF
jgi:hypothetical protein